MSGCGCGCGCGTTQTIETPATDGRDYLVAGMTCQPCATRVSTAVTAVPGVTGVTVDLAAGRITVEGTASDAEIQAAVTDAGYQITNS
ncbi:heavy-metal-associated domain-containing protein [Micromonospora sp. NPDC003197]